MGEHPWKAGRVLAGRYRLEDRLGEGGMGSIWRAEHLVLKAPVAVKLMDPQIAGEPETMARFIREAQAAATLRSPHVVQIIDYGMDGLAPFMVMELLEGETLADRIKRNGRLLPADTVHIFTQVARAVQRAHEAGIVHRDLKPENVFLVHNQDEDVAKVLDFGIAKMNVSHLGPSGARTKTGSLIGTPFYMSPEQAQGNKAIDHRSDYWSLGVIAFEMLTGQKPFYSDGLGDLVLQICVRQLPVPSQFAPVPPGFDAWFARATARDPEHRFQSAREMADSLRDALGIEGRELDVSEAQRGAPLTARSLGPSAAPVTPAIAANAATSTRFGLGPQEASGADDPARAATVLLGANQKPSLTVKQFGTTSQSAPPARTSSAGPLVLAVAASALVIGLISGVAVLRRRAESGSAPPAVSAPALEPQGRVEQVAPPTASAEPRPEPPPEVEMSPEQGSHVAGPDVRVIPSADAERTRTDAKTHGAADAGTSSPSTTVADAGWVKPAWARPDDEPANSANSEPSPSAPDSSSPPPAQSSAPSGPATGDQPK